MKKRIVIVVYVCMLIVMSVITSCVFVWSANTVKKIDLSESNLRNNIGHLILYEAKQTDPHYSYLSFQKGVKKKQKEQYNETMNRIMYDYTVKLRHCSDFYYAIKTKKSGIVDEHGKRFKKKSLDLTLTYKKEQVSGTNANLYKTFDSSFVNLFTSTGYNSEISYEKREKLEKAIDSGIVKINPPKNMMITMQVPQTLTTTYMREILGQYSRTIRDVTAVVFLASVILLFFMLFVPMNIIENIEPFSSIKHWYLIMNVFLIMMGLALGFGLVYQINANLFEVSSDQMIDLWAFNMQMPGTNMSLLMVFFAMLLNYFLISLSVFGIKYIIMNIHTYFQDHTFIGAFIRFSKRTEIYMNELFDDHYVKALGKTLLIQTIWLVGLTLVIYVVFNPSPFYFIILYLVVIVFYFFYLLHFYSKKVYQMKSQYEVLVDQAKDLSNGNFSEVHEDLGVFNSLRDEMNHVKDGFEAAVQEEVKSTTMKTELISNVSHDLKTPLTCIKNYVILLKDAKTKEDMQEYTTQIENYTNRLSSLIEDLFEVSKVNSGNVTLHTTSLDLLSLLNQAIVENEEKLETKDLKVIKSADLESAMCLLDGEKTYRVLDNLLGNISKYAMPHTRVYIDVTHDDKTVSIALKNISEAQMNFTSEEIVERFVRGDKSRHVAGSGLGLAIAKSFTEVMGGTFELTVDGDMFKVILTFPLDKNTEKDQ